MENERPGDLIAKCMAIFIFVVLLGIAPRPHAVRTGLEEARRAQTSDSSRRAAAELAPVAEALPWWPGLWRQAGHAALDGGAPDDAIAYFQRAAERGELAPEDYLALGDAYDQVGETQAAAPAWEQVDSSSSAHPEALTRLVEAHLAGENFAPARSALEDLIASSGAEARYAFPLTSLEGASYPLAYHLGLLLAVHAAEAAPPALRRAAEIDPGLADQAADLAESIQAASEEESPGYTALVAGQTLAEHGRWDLAVHAFRRATRLLPDYAEAWAYLGEAYQHLDRQPDALTALEQALESDIDSLAANAFTAIYWQRQGDLAQARRYLKRAARLESRNPALQIYLGELWAQEGELDTAQLYYQNAIDLARRDPAVWRAYADFCLRYSLDLHTQALPAARQAVLLAPDDPDSLDTLGLVLFRLGDRLNAERSWRRALAQDGDHAPTHLHLGVLYWYRGEIGLARRHLSLASSLAPASPTGSQARRIVGGIALSLEQ